MSRTWRSGQSESGSKKVLAMRHRSESLIVDESALICACKKACDSQRRRSCVMRWHAAFVVICRYWPCQAAVRGPLQGGRGLLAGDASYHDVTQSRRQHSPDYRPIANALANELHFGQPSCAILYHDAIPCSRSACRLPRNQCDLPSAPPSRRVMQPDPQTFAASRSNADVGRQCCIKSH